MRHGRPIITAKDEREQTHPLAIHKRFTKAGFHNPEICQRQGIEEQIWHNKAFEFLDGNLFQVPVRHKQKTGQDEKQWHVKTEYAVEQKFIFSNMSHYDQKDCKKTGNVDKRIISAHKQ